MNSPELSRQALLGTARLHTGVAVLLFLPAWTLRYWQAWAYWMLVSVSVLFNTLYFLRHDPALVERRLVAGPAAEPERSQRLIQSFAGTLASAMLVLASFDHRYRWSSVPAFITWGADAAVAAGLLMVFAAFRANSYAASAVQTEANQTVAATGPYARVRHPMYTGTTLAFLATPCALGSLWALIPSLLLSAALVARLLHEERFLRAHLQGYEAYCHKVRDRLIPGLW